MATIRKRNDEFQVQVRIRGHSKSATFLTLKHIRHLGRQKESEFEKSFQLGELYRSKHFLEVLDLYRQKVTPLKKSSNNEYIHTLMKEKYKFQKDVRIIETKH